MARSRRFSRRGGRPLRGMDWDVAQLQTATTGRGTTDRQSTVSGYVVLPSDVRARWVDPTLMATRTFIQCAPQSSVTPATFVGAGLIMWSDPNDSAPQGTDCPDPLRDGDLDWINRWVFLFLPAGVQGGPNSLERGGSNIFDITHLSKAKRRFGNQQGLLMAFSALEQTETQALGFNVMADVRALIKE